MTRVSKCLQCSDAPLTMDNDSKVTFIDVMKHADPCEECPHGQYTLSQLRWLHLSFYEMKMIKKHGPKLEGKIRPCPIPKWETQPEFWVPEDRVGETKTKTSGFGGSFFDRVKDHVNILDVAETITDLQGMGNTLTGKCPLHDEQSGRSFVVWTETQTWRCFGRCNIGGDVIKLVQECMERNIEWKKKSHHSMQQKH